MKHLHPSAWILGACATLALSACGGGGSAAATINGSVSGLAAGASVTLQDQNATMLSVSGNAAFTFADTLVANAAYVVTVVAQPAGATCSVANGSGTVDASADPVGNVLVTCAPGASVGGTVTGLAAGTTLVLSDGTSTLPLSAGGRFAFTDPYADGAAYAVSVAAQPVGQLCTVANAAGAVDAGGDAVTNVSVTCATAPPLGGTVVGLAPGTSITLSDGASTTVVSANGAYGFADSFVAGQFYQVSVQAQPAGQLCSLGNSSGTFDGNGDPIGNVAVACATNGTVGGTVTGLAAGGTLTLTDGNTTLAVSANGSFAFTDLVAPGMPYSATVSSQPAGQTCTVQGGAGLVDGADDPVTTVHIVCI